MGHRVESGRGEVFGVVLVVACVQCDHHACANLARDETERASHRARLGEPASDVALRNTHSFARGELPLDARLVRRTVHLGVAVEVRVLWPVPVWRRAE